MAITSRGLDPMGGACPPGLVPMVTGSGQIRCITDPALLGTGGRRRIPVPPGVKQFQTQFPLPSPRQASEFTVNLPFLDPFEVTPEQIIEGATIIAGTFTGDPTTTGCPPDCGPPGTDPTPIGRTPAEVSVSGTGGLALPFQTAVSRLQCPTFGNGKVGILWMQPLSGDIVCLPRGVNGRPFGLIRKNKPRRKPLLTAGFARSLREVEKGTKVLKRVSKAAGLSCKKK